MVSFGNWPKNKAILAHALSSLENNGNPVDAPGTFQ
jgi:hypothetical protein